MSSGPLDSVALLVAGAALAVCAYAYGGYPLLLLLWGRLRRPPRPPGDAPHDWPAISISLPVHNEEATIRGAIDTLLAADYPVDRRQIVVISDASTDRTDAIVAAYAERGVELLRLPKRSGKTAAENAARSRLRGDIVVNTDASVRIHPQALVHLVARFWDPSVGVASARDVSVDPSGDQVSAGEGSYVSYEMWVRDLETRVCGIVGASGCCYATRAFLHRQDVRPALSRDFAAALVAREHGLRAVSVRAATCFVPRLTSLHGEYRRKVRTVERGLATLWDRRRLLNPARYGMFAWMLLSHKLCRWLVPWTVVAASLALGALSVAHAWARGVAGAVLLSVLIGGLGWIWPSERPMPRLVAVPAFAWGTVLATLHAWCQRFKGDGAGIWEPSRRESLDGSVAMNR